MSKYFFNGLYCKIWLIWHLARNSTSSPISASVQAPSNDASIIVVETLVDAPRQSSSTNGGRSSTSPLTSDTSDIVRPLAAAGLLLSTPDDQPGDAKTRRAIGGPLRSPVKHGLTPKNLLQVGGGVSPLSSFLLMSSFLSFFLLFWEVATVGKNFQIFQDFDDDMDASFWNS